MGRLPVIMGVAGQIALQVRLVVAQQGAAQLGVGVQDEVEVLQAECPQRADSPCAEGAGPRLLRPTKTEVRATGRCWVR